MTTANPKIANLTFYTLKFGIFIIICLLIYPIFKSILIWFGQLLNNPKENWRTVSSSLVFTFLLSYKLISNKYINRVIWNKLRIKLMTDPDDNIQRES